MSRQKSIEPIKTKKLDIRVSEKEKEAINNAAKRLSKKTTKWVLETLLKEANRINGADDN